MLLCPCDHDVATMLLIYIWDRKHWFLLEISGENGTLTRQINARTNIPIISAVCGILLVHDNPAQIEGRINGQQIVILTEFVKKSG